MKTNWFSGESKPTLKGVYERVAGASITFSQWDGSNWLRPMFSIDEAAACTEVSAQQSLPWRGLSQPVRTEEDRLMALIAAYCMDGTVTAVQQAVSQALAAAKGAPAGPRQESAPSPDAKPAQASDDASVPAAAPRPQRKRRR